MKKGFIKPNYPFERRVAMNPDKNEKIIICTQ